MSTTSKKRASKSGNPAVRAAAKPTAVADFKKKQGGLFELPSGVYMRLKNPGGLSLFMKRGIIPNSLMTIVNEALEKGKEPDMSAFVGKDGTMDPQNMEDMLSLIDHCMVECAVEPRVLLHVYTAETAAEAKLDDSWVGKNIPEGSRDPEQLYSDEITEEDKMFVFQWLTGGTTDVEQFRKELTTGMGNLLGS